MFQLSSTPAQRQMRNETVTYLSTLIPSISLSACVESKRSSPPIWVRRMLRFPRINFLSLLSNSRSATIQDNSRFGRDSQRIRHNRAQVRGWQRRRDTCARILYVRRDHLLLIPFRTTVVGDCVECLGPTSVAPSDGHATRRSPTWKFTSNTYNMWMNFFAGRIHVGVTPLKFETAIPLCGEHRYRYTSARTCALAYNIVRNSLTSLAYFEVQNYCPESDFIRPFYRRSSWNIEALINRKNFSEARIEMD